MLYCIVFAYKVLFSTVDQLYISGMCTVKNLLALEKPGLTERLPFRSVPSASDTEVKGCIRGEARIRKN